MNKSTFLPLLVSLLATSAFVACNTEEETIPEVVETVEFKNRSLTPSFVKMGADFSNVGVFTLVSSEDPIPNSNNMVYGGAPDGQGFIKNPD